MDEGGPSAAATPENLVPPTGLEPVRRKRGILSPLCLPIPPRRHIGLPCRIRTCDPQLRRLLLYPAELRAVIWWAHRDSNSEPTDYESGALTN